MPKNNEKYTKELLEEAVKDSESYAGVMRYLNLKMAGGTHSHIKRRIDRMGIDTSHFLGQAINRGKTTWNKNNYRTILVEDRLCGNKEKTKVLRRAMIESGIKHVCSSCNNEGEWNGKPLVLQIDHIDGNPINNKKENLTFLCPNCHSQTSTYGAKNFSNHNNKE